MRKRYGHARRLRPGAYWLFGCAGITLWFATVANAQTDSTNEQDRIDAGGIEGKSEAANQPTSNADSTTSNENSFTELSLEELMDVQVVVTTSRHEQKITSVPYAISVITAEDIRAAGARSVPDALRLAPGVDVADLSFGNAAVSPRGFHGLYANKVLVLVDGRQIFDTLFNGTYWGVWPFQLEDIDRIEVIRGPGGVTWGANAVNGVINIITKDPKDQLGLTVTTRGGSRGTHKEHVGYAFQDGKLRMRLSGEFEGSDGFKARGGSRSALDDDYISGRVGLHAIYESSPDDTLTFSLGSSVVNNGFPLPWFSSFDTVQPKAQASFVLGSWSHSNGPSDSYTLTAYINDFHITSGPKWTDYRYQQFAFQFAHTFSPSEEQTVSWGIDTRWDLTSAANADPFMLSQDIVRSGAIGVYLQEERQIASRWTLNLGGRVDYDFYGGFEPSGRASLSYAVNESSSLWGAVSRAFHMPSGARRFIDLPLLGPPLRVTSARGLDPEILYAYEVGYRSQVSDRLMLDLNVYWNHYRNVIATRPQLGPPGLVQLQADNDSSLSLYGVEVGLHYAATNNLLLLANYTYQDTESHASLSSTGSLSPPKNKFMVGARYSPADNLHLSSHLYYVDSTDSPNGAFPFGPQSIDSYVRLDLRAEYELPDDQGSLAVGVQNLLDSGHAEGGASSMANAEVPRMIFAELRFSIK